MTISNDHVGAINLVEVEFYGCYLVQSAWKIYAAHLNDNEKPEDDVWRDKRDTLLAKLLFEMGRVLDFDMPAIDIYKGGYAPGGWQFRDMRQTGALEYLFELSKGKNVLPISIQEKPTVPVHPQEPKDR